MRVFLFCLMILCCPPACPAQEAAEGQGQPSADGQPQEEQPWLQEWRAREEADRQAAEEKAQTQAMAPEEPQEEEGMLLKGYVVDNKCADGLTPEQLNELILSHTKECALSPDAISSGYGIFLVDELKFITFDRASNKKIVEYLKKASSILKITIRGQEVAEGIHIMDVKKCLD